MQEILKLYQSLYILQPGRDERKFIKTIHAKCIYDHADRSLMEKHYRLHLSCASSDEFHPPIFSRGNDGKLAIREDRYYAYKNKDALHDFYPFSLEDIPLIQSAAQKGIAAEYEWKLEEYSLLFQDCLPELSFLLYDAIPRDEDALEECA